MAQELGGAIYSLRSGIFVNGTTFSRNSGRESGGAVYSVGTESTVGIFSNSTFEGNHSEIGSGGAISAGLAGGTYFLKSTFGKNAAGRTQPFLSGGYGGAISSYGSDLVIKDSLITRNISVRGGGGGVRHVRGSVRVVNSEITHNRSRYSGGGISTASSDLTIVDSIIEQNRAVNEVEGIRIFDDSSGGGISISSNNDENFLLIRGSSLSANVASMDGGGIFIEGGSASVIDTIVENNTVKIGRLASSGGGIAANGNLNILRTKIAKNRILSSLSEGDALGGGGLSFATGELNVSESEIVANYSEGNGGGISIQGGESVLFNTIVGSIFGGGNFAGQASTSEENQLLGNGGGIFLTLGADLQLIGGQISNNVAVNSGGGIFARQESRVVTPLNNLNGTQALINENQALRFDGGGVSLAGSATVFRDAIFENNAARGGAAISAGGGSLKLINVTNNNNSSRRNDDGFQISDDTIFEQIPDPFHDRDLAMAELDDLSSIV